MTLSFFCEGCLWSWAEGERELCTCGTDADWRPIVTRAVETVAVGTYL